MCERIISRVEKLHVRQRLHSCGDREPVTDVLSFGDTDADGIGDSVCFNRQFHLTELGISEEILLSSLGLAETWRNHFQLGQTQ
jgi:hypothetical protein